MINEWHSTVSNKESEDWLEETRLLFIPISEMSGFFPVAIRHPVLLDVVSEEMVSDIEESVSTLSLRGFKLHTLFTQLPNGSKIHQVSFPHLKGNASTVLVIYEEEIFPPDLRNHPKMEIDLQAPAMDHWNVTLDKILPLTMERFWCQQGNTVPPSTQAEASHPEGTSDGEPARSKDQGTAPSREQVLEATQNDLRLQSMHELGSIREMDRALDQTLMAEFASADHQ